MTLIPQTRSEDIVELMYMSYIRLYGFLQVYQLQTENDEEETWKDLVRRKRVVLFLVFVCCFSCHNMNLRYVGYTWVR